MLAMLVVFVFYLVWNTGIHSDDYQLIEQARQWTLTEYLLPDIKSISVLVFGPVSYYFDYFPYFAFGFDTLWAYDVVKALTSLLCIVLIQRFAADYLPPARAWVAAVVYVLLPNHDATLYWVLTLVYVLTPALVMFAHHLVRHEKYGTGSVVGMLGAFTSYASPPLTFGLALIFLVERSYKKAAVFLAPGVLYVAYYFAVQKLPGVSGGRINADLSIGVLVNRFLLQMGSFLDAAVGPSFWFKMWYSASAITVTSVMVAIATLAFLYRVWPSDRATPPKSLWAGLIAMTLLALGMFALTGLYPQIAFNLGDRVMVYGTLLTAFAIAALPLGRRSFMASAAVFVLAVLGLSDHWKDWNIRQQQVIANIRSQSSSLVKIPTDSVLLVAGYPYSQLGAMSHIEFLSETFGVVGVFNRALGTSPGLRLHALRNWYRVEGNTLLDAKYGERFVLSSNVWLYNAETNTLKELNAQELANAIATLPDVPRHWLQLGDDNLLRSVVLKFMPRLEYAFKR
ncbi:MAG: hypothetical protein Q7R66_09720 [Undibacterium sp.]|uniref:hypothetical protein n=1 Tax=Undibacterium sp. TaxID=1914977 RepID=UPI00271FE637|nr:hypothetical protein [Undibacterium sp.]MDO8652455.1 hypothetical protein [Undibacterium sp.]